MNTKGLWLKFKIKENLYAIDCSFVKYIGVVPKKELIEMSGASEYVSGIFKFNNEIVTLLNMRRIFDFENIFEEANYFLEKIEKRKNDYDELKELFAKNVKLKEKTIVSEKSDKWDFDSWYENNKSKYSTVNFVFQKIYEPHQEVFNLINSANSLISENEPDLEQKLDEILNLVYGEYMQEIISFLDEAKKNYVNSIREMFISINEKTISAAFTIDEVIGIEPLEVFEESAEARNINLPDFVSDISRDEQDNLVMIIDIHKVVMMAEQFDRQKNAKAEFAKLASQEQQENLA